MKQFKISLLIACLISLIPLPAMAVPDTVSYQGYLTDPSGSPVDGSVSVTFALYDSAAAITASWAETQTVAVSKGLFQVQLGSVGGGGFSSNLFDIPMWLGIQVGTDLEMTPRQPLTSAGYALKAEDADSVSGKTAVMLDQSAHVSDTGNPHSVTTTQIGAAASADLTAHTANAANPHGVNAVQVGAPSSAAFNVHTANPSAHHTRYSNSEAVSAMGVKNAGNSLNHDQFTNTQAVAAIIAADGAGSTLDADLLDGLHANDIIDAAQDEVRIPISSLPFTINQSGSYYLTQNLTATAGSGNRGINVNADKVTIDLMGFALEGNAVVDHGIYLFGKSGVVIKNGIISRFGLAGIFNSSTLGNNNIVTDVQVLGNGSLGSSFTFSGIYLNGISNRVDRCIVKDSGGYGIFVGANSIVKDSSVDGSGGAAGIRSGSSSSLSHNTAYNNEGAGIYAEDGSNLSYNTASYNKGDYGIYGGVGANLSYNNARFNQGWGIYAFTSNNIIGNTITKNNISLDLGQGGLFVNADSRVSNNTLDNNHYSGIHIAGTDNILRHNHVTDSLVVGGISRCIHFLWVNNAAVGNTATGCTTEFSGVSLPASRFIDNISW